LHLNFEEIFLYGICKNILVDIFSHEKNIIVKQVVKVTTIRIREKNYFKKFPKKLLLKSQKRP
jgi:hypothetical protein